MSLRKGNITISGLGSDGYSPTATVSKSSNVTTISITDKNGTTSSQVYDGDSPEVITSSTSTYTISNLTANKSYKLGEITSLTITVVATFDIESVIYFESGSTATTISVPDTLTNLGDYPTLTTSTPTAFLTSIPIPIPSAMAIWVTKIL